MKLTTHEGNKYAKINYESPEIDLHKYSQLMFGKGAKAI